MSYRKSRIYRVSGQEVWDACEALNLDYDIWNAEGVLFGNQSMELGLSEDEWRQVDAYLGTKTSQLVE